MVRIKLERCGGTMSNPPTPNPVNRKALSRASIVGAVLGVVGIILFVVLWVVFGQLGMTQIPRILLSLCVPPAILALLIGAYALYSRPRL